MYFLVRFSDRFSNKSTSSRHSVLIKWLRLKNSPTQRPPPHTAYFTVLDIGIQWEKIMSVYMCLFFVLEYFCISFSLRFSDFQINWHPQGTSGWLSMLTKQLRLKNSLTQRPPQHMSPMLNTWPYDYYSMLYVIAKILDSIIGVYIKLDDIADTAYSLQHALYPLFHWFQSSLKFPVSHLKIPILT